jgi:dTMP kinase
LSSLNEFQFLGRLITIEGSDGTGKSTQIELLCKHLRSTGHSVVMYDFPHKKGTPIGDLIGSFLQGNFGDVTPEFLALAFAVDRLESRTRLLADLEAGHTVICDRYVRSNIAFQSAKTDSATRRSQLEALLIWVEYTLFKLPIPDLELVLFADDIYFSNGQHLRRETNQERQYIGQKADIHEDATELQMAVNNYYATLPSSNRLEKISIFDGNNDRRSVADLHIMILRAIATCIEPLR